MNVNPRSPWTVRVAGAATCLLSVSTLLGCAPLGSGPSSSTPKDALIRHAAGAASTCVEVTQSDETMIEQTVDDEPVRAYSITKSVTSLLVGIAQDRGLLEIDDAVSSFVPQWHATPSQAVTIHDLLTNTSGREWDSRTDYREMALTADDKTAFALGLGQQEEPGTEWIYNNSAVQVLEAVLESATGMPVDQFAATALFEPLGMTRSRLESDAAGNANVFAGLWTTCDDLIELGQMLLDNGAGPDGDQVISVEYLASATSTPGTDLNAAYGLLWWLNHPGSAVTPEVATSGRGGAIEGPLVPGAPVDTFWALGFHDQILAVIPSEDTVAVRLGGRPPEESDFDVRVFTEDVLDVIAEVRSE